MGVSKQSRNWALTWRTEPEDQIVDLEPTGGDGVRVCTGNHNYLVVVGPKESTDENCPYDHQHMLVHCDTAAISKTKVKEALVEYSGLAPATIEKHICYISECRDKKAYKKYMFKSVEEKTSCRDDNIVKKAINDLKIDGVVPTSTGIKRKLIEENGANAFNKRFKMIAETYLAETDVIDCRGKPKIIFDPDSNRTNFVTQLMMYYTLLHQTEVSTTCKPFEGVGDDMLKDIVFLLSLLPYFTNRVIGGDDNLPSLYLYGVQCAGKSSMFNNCRYFKKVPTDSSGVSRFRIDKMHTSLLLDDVENDFINQKENSSTLKQLTLGGNAEIKVMGNTQNIKAFVIITSNETPSFLEPTDYIDVHNKTKDERNKDIVNRSWMRRFICCNFVDTCPYDADSINYDDLILRDMAAHMFRDRYVMMLQRENEYEVKDLNVQAVLKKFEVYYNIALNDYGSEKEDDYYESIAKAAVTIVDKANEALAEDGITMLIDKAWKPDTELAITSVECVLEEIVEDITDDVDMNEPEPEVPKTRALEKEPIVNI